MVARVRPSLISIIYRQTTRLRDSDMKDSAALTLMGTDVERIVQALRTIHEVWASVIEVSLAVWLLARQLSWASAVPLVISLGKLTILKWHRRIHTLTSVVNVSLCGLDEQDRCFLRICTKSMG